jgi:DNA-binding NtrC family response regulator
MDRPRVLVVEDRPSLLKLMATILEETYEVVTAADVPAALSLLESAARVDVVLTDIRMPHLSGFDVLRAVQRGGRSTAVVMMTAYANVPDAVTAIKLGAFDYVAKPLDADEIALVVARAVDEVVRHVAAAEDGPVVRRTEETGANELVDVAASGFHSAVEHARERASRQYLEKLMRAFHGNVTHAAKRAGVTRESLHRLLKKYGVRSEHHKDEAIAPAARDLDGTPRAVG